MTKYILPSRYSDYIGKICTSPTPRPIREKPDGSGPIIGMCYAGEPWMLLGCDPSVPDSRYWVTRVKILYGDTIGWIVGDIFEYEGAE